MGLTWEGKVLCNEHILSPYFMPTTMQGLEGPESLNTDAHVKIHTEQRWESVIAASFVRAHACKY